MLHKASAFIVSANELGVQFLFGWPAICTRLRRKSMQIALKRSCFYWLICMLFLQPFACLLSECHLLARTTACGWRWKSGSPDSHSLMGLRATAISLRSVHIQSSWFAAPHRPRYSGRGSVEIAAVHREGRSL
mgnify:CR=1 FL=1